VIYICNVDHWLKKVVTTLHYTCRKYVKEYKKYYVCGWHDQKVDVLSQVQECQSNK
jgi:hypothetical protein